MDTDDVDAYEAQLREGTAAPWRGVERKHFVALALALSPFAPVGLCAAEVGGDSGILAWMALWGVACVVALVLGIKAIVAMRRKTVPVWLGLLTAAAGLLSPLVSFVVGVMTSGGYTRGRALKRRGKALLPELAVAERTDAAWVEPGASIIAPAAAATGWRVNAATETASVAAFAHLANDLLAVGAPPSLIASAHADALDEIRHAQLCYGIASAIDGDACGPAPFPAAAHAAPTPTLASVAAEAILESCVFERASAMVAERLASEAASRRIRAALLEIAEDEGRHADHGWEILAWCRRAGGAEVDTAILRALKGVDSHGLPGAVPRDDWGCYGLAGPLLWQRCVEEAVTPAFAALDAANQTARNAAA